MTVNQPAGGSINNRGAWSGTAGYNPFDFVQNAGVGYLNGVAVAAPPNGAPTLDNTPVFNHSVSSSGNVTFNTSTSTGLVVLAVAAGAILNAVPTSSHLTWTRRGGVSSGNAIDVYTAPCSGPLTGEVVSFTFAGAQFWSAGVCSFANFSAFDTQAGLPLTGTNTTLSLTTADAADMLLFIEGTSNGNTLTPPAGFTAFINSGASGVNLMISGQRVNATQSGLSLPVANQVSGLADALFGITGGTNTAPGSDPTHWIG